MTRRGINYTVRRIREQRGGYIFDAYLAEIDWPTSGRLQYRSFAAHDIPLSEARAHAKQWARDRIDDYLNAQQERPR